ncbi:MAG TPA: DUF5676 family membrane protein [Patescibacteria group bacterium]|nr:DUF5676 family membrane protein [Patescibacteria group bacterium]
MAVIKEKAVANAAAVWVGGVYIFCSLAFVLFPGVSRLVAQSWFHGFDMSKMWVYQPIRSNFGLGLVTAVGLTWIAAWLFAWLINYFGSTSKR